MSSFGLPDRRPWAEKSRPVRYDELSLGQGFDQDSGDTGSDDSADGLLLSGWASKGQRPQQREISGPSKAYADEYAAKEDGPNYEQVTAQVASELARAYAGYHQVSMQQIAAKQAADTQGFRARMLELDYRFALRRAESMLRQRDSEIGRLSLEGSQRRAEVEASTAGRGVDGGGSAAEVLLSDRLIEAIDVYNVNLNGVKQANAERRRALRARQEAAFARVTERNLRRTARYAMPEAALIAGLGSAGASSSGSSKGS